MAANIDRAGAGQALSEMPRWLPCVAGVIVLDIVLAVVVLPAIGSAAITRLAAPAFTDPNPTSPLRIVALGDSYMSGEGAQQYFAGTDQPGANICRRAPTAYPVLVAATLNASLTFAACSGATTKNIVSVGQQIRSSPDVSGGEPQISILEHARDPSIVLLSIGGNDAGFAAIGTGCSLDRADCRGNANYWLNELDQNVYPRLLDTYRKVKQAAPRAQVFVFTYPNPLGPTHCAALPIGLEEQAFLRDEFLPRLNLLIDFAATVAQVRVIDLAHALDKNRLCGSGAPDAVNLVGLGGNREDTQIGNWVRNIFHPNDLGHQLMAAVVTTALTRWRLGSLPPIPGEPPPDISPPPYVPSEIGVPLGPYDFPQGTGCVGREIVSVLPVAAPNDLSRMPFHVIDAIPGSKICYHGYKETWRSDQASPSGELKLSLDTSRPGVGSTSEILYQTTNNAWMKVVVSRVDVTSPKPPAFMLAPWIAAAIVAAVAGVLGLEVWVVVRCSRRRRRELLQ